MRTKAFYNLIRNLKKKDLERWFINIFFFAMFVGAMIGLFLGAKYFEPQAFTEEETALYYSTAETIWHDGLEKVDFDDEDFTVSIDLPSQITIKSNSMQKGSITFDFSEPVVKQNVETADDSYVLNVIYSFIIGGFIPAIILTIIYCVVCLIAIIIKFFIKIYRNYKEKLNKLN